MSAFRRPAVLALFVGIILTGYFCFAIAHVSGLPTARTPYGRLFGLLGFTTIVGSSLSRLWEQEGEPQTLSRSWHNVLGLLSVWLILLHSHLHFGNVVATLAFALLLVVVISGGIVTWANRAASSPSTPAKTREARPVPGTQLDVRRERLVLLHIAVTVGLLTFSLFHILAIWYY